MRSSFFALPALAAARVIIIGGGEDDEPSRTPVTCPANACYSMFTSDTSSASSFCSSFLGTSTSTTAIIETQTAVETLFTTLLLTETDQIVQTETLLSTEVDQLTVVETAFTTDLETSIVATAVETVITTLSPPHKRDVVQGQLKKRKVCPPKTMTTTTTQSTPISISSSTSSTSTPLSTSSAPVCTNPTQISSACSCLGVTGGYSVVTEISTIQLTATETSVIQETITQTQEMTSEVDIFTTLTQTDLEFTTVEIDSVIPVTAAATTTIAIPAPTAVQCLLRVLSVNSPDYGNWIQASRPNGAPQTLLQFVSDMSQATAFTTDPDTGALVPVSAPDLLTYYSDGGDVSGIVLSDGSDAQTNGLDVLSFRHNMPGPYYAGDSGLLKIASGGYANFMDCFGGLWVAHATSPGCPIISSAYDVIQVQYIFQ